ncbi:zinc-dependent alcohol dehydrogenase family protein [Streptomyces fuscigenes]|uniref:zinc-dependent alcohol dehydrogenase family protein n=1 Tax=Streptomyces fuscigenes TaxID=1528880 RepID=UPI001F1EA737|nr:zinc-dependent alcohol dehydrogenase family protein [Streptomyces fuscigenes]MCF3965488.1 zinc-dependent alcohol dehydrogenase family protein [Streptomyces fuscigenes]
MRATVINAPYDIQVEEVPDAAVRKPTDVVLRVLRACICGSDLWPYRGEVATAPRPGQRIGHEFLGVVEEAGSEVTGFRPGDLAVAPFMYSDGLCDFCREGVQTSCVHGGGWGGFDHDGGQGEAVRVPYADGTLVKLPKDAASDDRVLAALLTLSDVMGTGHHAAVGAEVRAGGTVAVVGDGAVGLCGVLAAKRLGAEQIVILGRHTERTDIARSFGATHVVAQRGDEAVEAVRELTKGHGAHSVIEAVGTEQSMTTAVRITRPGGSIGYVGAPHGSGDGIDLRHLFDRNIALRGGLAPVRQYLPELLADVLSGAIDPSPVFDATLGLDRVADGYRAMNDRTALKVLLAL